MPTRFANLDRTYARLLLFALLLALLAGLVVVVASETVYVPPPPVEGAPERVPGPDLQLYRTVVARVHTGENYYDVAREELPRWGFPYGSMFNWRPPTYAYLLGALPGSWAVRAVLVLIAAAGMILAFAAEQREREPLGAACTMLLLFGVAAWSLVGDACFAQEVWAGLLILLSVSAAGCGVYSERWRTVSVGAGLLALFFRELALPYCAIAGVLALWHRRRLEALAWFAGIALFALFLWWHGEQVAARLTPEDRIGSAGISGWIVFGGLPFDVMATRMNALVMVLPGWLVFVYLFLGVIGLLNWPGEQATLLTLTTLAYLAAFAIVGKPMNFNWGLMFAPMLPFGVVRAPAALRALGEAIRAKPAPTRPESTETPTPRE